MSELLLESDAIDLDWANEDGDTALHVACANGFATCAELLLPSEESLDFADLNCVELKLPRLFSQNNAGETALHLAARRSLGTVVQRMIKLGASLLVLDKNGQHINY